jgi:tetratricopeptide (TPR) repeat protein
MEKPAAGPDALVEAATSLFQRGQFDAAISGCNRALEMRPAHRGALTLLGVALNASGQHAKASEVFAELARRNPKQADHWMNLGTSLLAQRRNEAALEAYARAGALGEASSDFFYNVGLVHREMGNFEAARTVLRDAARLAPDDAEIAYQYAVCCDETMRHADAIAALADWPRMRGLKPDLLAKIALLLMKLGELRSAVRAVELAAHDPSPDPESVLRIVQVQERTNRLAEAQAGLARLKADPRSKSLGDDLKLVEARLAERLGRAQEAHDLYQELLASTTAFHQRHHHLFPLARLLDALGRSEAAYSALEEAHRSQMAFLCLTAPNAVRRQGPPFRLADLGCDAADVGAWDAAAAPSAEGSPIFIVGFPRSGTTLLEQVLDAHPSLASMDETRFMHDAIDCMVKEGCGYPGRLAAMSATLQSELRDRYWSLVRSKVDLQPGQRLVDKNPLNLLALPAIRRLFPHSRILVAVRHPCDVILSCYMQHFSATDFVLLCRDLPSLATAYRRAFDCWYREAEILKPAAREVRYEALVSGFEAEVRGIAGFLGLGWTDAMLEPGRHAEHKGFIGTPSYSQVVQPVHTRSIGRWKSYESHFAGVLPTLQPYFDRWGYDATIRTEGTSR